MRGDVGMCDGKKSFLTYWAAIKSAKNLNNHQQSAKANIYRCPRCRHFHVGNSLHTKRKAKRHTYSHEDLEAALWQ